MSDISPKLALPYIQPSQAQKHVTHNEAIQRLDVLVQAVVKDSTLATPPAAPDAGDSYIVPVGGTGVWAGYDDDIATFRENGWEFITPKNGWSVHDLSRNARLTYGDAGWSETTGNVQVAQLGVSASSDATNRLSVSSPASLLNHAGGSHQLKLNKAAPADTASLLFQSGFSGRAEMGLAGNDGWSLKVSADGSAWKQALHVDAAAEMVSIAPAGTPRLRVGDSDVEIGVPITGAAVQSGPLDATTGRLMKTAAFGWGADDTTLDTPPGGDFNALRTTGFWRATGSETGAPPFPAGIVQHMCRLAGAGSDGRHIQIAFDAVSAQMALRRSQTGGGWTDWQKTTPTSGTNANGTFLRFPTGVQICFRNEFTLDYQNAVSVGYNWTFPAAFSERPVVVFNRASAAGAHLNLDRRDLGANLSAISPSPFTGVTFSAYTLPGITLSPTASVTNCNGFAIGHWA